MIRFWKKVDRSGGPDACWTWTAAKDPRGYGRFGYEYKTYLAHRFAYELVLGPVGAGLFVCHSCDNPSCVNPGHLFTGSHDDNMRDMSSKGRSYPQTHESMKGEDSGNAKLTDAQVLQIRSRTDNQTLCAKEFGVHKSLISLIRRRKAWKHLP